MFPDDFFDSLRPSTPNYTKPNKKIPHPKIITHPLTTKHREIDNNSPIKEEIIEESIVSNYPYTEEKRTRPSLDIDICNEETSGSSNASNNNSNKIKSCNQKLPICFNSNINPNDFYSIPTFTSPNERICENNDDIFKQTPHFINFETEPPQEQRKKVMTQRTKSANRIERQKSSDKINRTPNTKKRPSTERSNQKRVTTQTKNNKLNLPKILPHTLVEKELSQLMSNVPSKFFDDPEVKKKFNLLMKNIDDIKEVIQKKTNHGYFNAKTGNHCQNNNKDTNCFKRPISKTNKKNVIIQPKKKI